MILIVFSILLLLVITYLLLMPIILKIDTSSNYYCIQIKGLAKANIEADKKELIKINFKVLVFNFSIYPLKKKQAAEKNTIAKNKTKKKHYIKMNFKTGLRLLKSFKIKKMHVDIDTGNCISNAKLYPIFALLNYKRGGWNINFEGRNQLVLYIQNRPIDIIKSFINI